MNNKGLNQRRFADNPLEKAYADQWEKDNKEGRLLECILAKEPNYIRDEVTDRDREVAATVIQWLGSPCGQSFVEEVINREQLRKRYK